MEKNILFLCTGNSCRSQMAEGFGKALKGSKFNFFSAGTKKHGINQRAVKVMREVGVDISDHTSNLVEELNTDRFDYIITVCSHAHETCPYVAHSNVVHVGFDDPPALTKDMDDEDQILSTYRRVRDEIKLMVTDIESHLP